MSPFSTLERVEAKEASPWHVHGVCVSTFSTLERVEAKEALAPARRRLPAICLSVPSNGSKPRKRCLALRPVRRAVGLLSVPSNGSKPRKRVRWGQAIPAPMCPFSTLERVEAKEVPAVGGRGRVSDFQYPRTGRSQGSLRNRCWTVHGNSFFQYPRTGRSQGSR